MPWPQVTMAVGLAVNTVLVLWLWLRTVTRAPPYLRPGQRLILQHGYLIAAIPLGEAWLLWCGGFWG